MTLTPALGQLRLLVATPVAGFAEQNATPTILSYTFPADGLLHRVLLINATDVTVAQTGGALGWSFTDPNGNTKSNINTLGAGQAVGVYHNQDGAICGAGTTVTYQQVSALTAGAAITWAELWGF